MEPGQPSPLQMPSFLQGSYASVHRKANEEGLRCGAQYRLDGTFPPPPQLREVAPGEVMIAEGSVDFQHEREAWRPYLMFRLQEGFWEALDWSGMRDMDERYEAFCRDTAWGALYFALGTTAPRSAERTALRVQALLRFWEPLSSARYLWKTPQDAMTLEELVVAGCDWVLEAWCPEGGESVRARLATAAERMAHASREQSIEAILRQLPRVLSSGRHFKHREPMMDPALQRQYLSTLDPAAFARVSGACTAELLMLLSGWDRQLGRP